ncbi:MAG: TIGR02281 family clan AA aspartic protease [Proteobacteria bacterium]|nr:TIGR02281 family clan AA aspartic protease [Pseudomonadota bacterium]
MSERPRGPWDIDEPTPAPKPPRPPGRVGLWLLLALGLAALVAALFRAFPEAVQKPDDWANLAWSLLLIALVGTGLFRLQRGGLAQHLRSVAIWLAVVGVLALGYAYRDLVQEAPQRLRLAFGAGYPIQTATHEVVVPQDERGAFVLNAQVNGQPVRFIVDTGATDTVLSPAAAERLGVDLKRLDFGQSAETANGMGYGAAYTAQRLAVGPIVFNDFPMVINQAPMSSSLLGLSFLNRLDSFEIRDRKLILKWREPQPRG